MLETRIIPCLQLIDDSLVKTVKFKNPDYIGDPINTVRIFNELEVDELCFLDIRASVEGRTPNFKILQEISNECFMPLSYGGAVKDFETAKRILSIGFEKIVLNTQAYRQKNVILELSSHFGSQSVVASIDATKNFWGKYHIFINDGTEKVDKDVVEWAKELEEAGAGELLVTSMDREGTWKGFDLELTKMVSDAVQVPVIANGGAGILEHIGEVVKKGNASAVGLGSMIVYQQRGMGVLVNFPDKKKLNEFM